MRNALRLGIFAAACALGAIAGLYSRSIGQAGAATASESAASPEGGAGSFSKGQERLPALGDDDARITRLFSALTEPVQLQRRHALFEALHELTSSDLPRLIARAESIGGSPGFELLEALLERWFEVDFAAAEEWMRAHPQYPHVGAWVRANPEAAIRGALAAPGDTRSFQLLTEALQQALGEDHHAKVARLRTLPPGELRDRALRTVINSLADSDPAAAFALVEEIGPGRWRDYAREHVLTTWVRSDPAAALQALNGLLPHLETTDLGHPLVTNVAHIAGQNDAPLVLEWLSGIPVEFRIGPAIAAASMWAQKEPIAALKWCLENGVEIARGRRLSQTSTTQGVLGQAMTFHPAATAEWIESLPHGVDREGLMERAVMESVITGLASSSPKSPMDVAVTMRLFDQLSPEAQVSSARALAESRAAQEGGAGLQDWIRNLASSEARANAYAGAATGLYRRDPALVEPLLANLTGSDRDAALQGISRAIPRAAPTDAAARALEIAQPELRREVLGRVISNWRSRDAAAATEWLRNAPSIPAGWKQEWLK